MLRPGSKDPHQREQNILHFLFQLTSSHMWGVLQADGMIRQVRNVSVVLVPAFQEADDGVEEEKEDEEEDDSFLQAHTEC